MSYFGAHKLGQLLPFMPLPLAPVPQPDRTKWNNEVDQWLNHLSDFVEQTNRTWVCLHCKTKTSIFTYIENGSKPCYNCGSTEGEIK
jgi:hypothetical protein